VTRAAGEGAVLAVAGDGAVDELGVLFAERVVADAEPVHDPGAEGFEKDVVVADET
jgi:hypothetical protein